MQEEHVVTIYRKYGETQEEALKLALKTHDFLENMFKEDFKIVPENVESKDAYYRVVHSYPENEDLPKHRYTDSYTMAATAYMRGYRKEI